MEGIVICNKHEEHSLRGGYMMRIPNKPLFLKKNHCTACTPGALPGGNRGIALVLALIVTLVVFLLVASTLYVVTRSTVMSGARNVYVTACEASDGAVEVTRDLIDKTIMSQPVPPVFNANPAFLTCLGGVGGIGGIVTGQAFSDTFAAGTVPECTTQITLPAATMGSFTATVTVTTLFRAGAVGTSQRYPPMVGSGGTSTFFRIDSVTAGPNGTSCENTALYRYSG